MDHMVDTLGLGASWQETGERQKNHGAEKLSFWADRGPRQTPTHRHL